MIRILRSWFAEPEFVTVVAKSSMAAALVMATVFALRGNA